MPPSMPPPDAARCWSSFGMVPASGWLGGWLEWTARVWVNCWLLALMLVTITQSRDSNQVSSSSYVVSLPISLFVRVDAANVSNNVAVVCFLMLRSGSWAVLLILRP